MNDSSRFIAGLVCCGISDMKSYLVFGAFFLSLYVEASSPQCSSGQSLTFTRWSGVVPERFAPVFVYTASGDEPSLTSACLAQCRDLDECSAVAVAYGKGSCQGLAAGADPRMKIDSDVAYFEKVCLDVSEQCLSRWWVAEATPGYHLNTEAPNSKLLQNATVRECYAALTSSNNLQPFYRSAQWIGQDNTFNPETIRSPDNALGSCILNQEDKFTEPENFRVANYQTIYLENQCRHDYSKKIDRCSYEEYYNQTLKHVELTMTNYTKDECKSLCEQEDHFVCRGFSWSRAQGRGSGVEGRGLGVETRGVCDLHSEDLVSTGSWLLRRSGQATYYRRVICLNISVDCTDTELVVTYRPRGTFRGRVYVPGHGERCSATASNGLVTLKLPLYGECDVNFAHAISTTPQGVVVNRTMAYALIMIQNNAIIQTAGDRWVRAGCAPARPGALSVDAALAVASAGKPSVASETSVEDEVGVGASAVLNPGSPAAFMYIVRGDSAAAPAAPAALGDPLELRIDTTDESEVMAYHLVASSRLGDSSVLLLDSRGCPTGQVDFPALSRSWAGGRQRLAARFKAFRFPSSHVVRFSVMLRRCNGNCSLVDCNKTNRAARNSNLTDSSDGSEAEVPGLVSAGGARCGEGRAGRDPLEAEMVVGSNDVLTAGNLVRADHRSTYTELEEDQSASGDERLVCVHELVLVGLALAWLSLQLPALLACLVLVYRYRNLAEMSMQKEYQSFDNVGFDTVSTHRRVHWPDQSVDILHAT